MADSSLVCYENYNVPHDSGRAGSGVGCIGVHHFVGEMAFDRIAPMWRDRGASTHYVIHCNGDIAQYVQECDTAYALADEEANQFSINIECSNDGGADTAWHVSDATIEACINLIVDICRRRGWKEFRYSGDDTNGELIAHRWYYATACPGDYLYAKFPYIANEVQRRLSGGKIDEDGEIGYETIYSWQKVMGSPYTDGEISGQMVDSENYVTSTTNAWVFNNGNGSVTVRTWQEFLESKGYSVGPDGCDGYFGEDTARATQHFLEDNGFSVGVHGCDGEFGPDSSRALQKWINSQL